MQLERFGEVNLVKNCEKITIHLVLEGTERKNVWPKNVMLFEQDSTLSKQLCYDHIKNRSSFQCLQKPVKDAIFSVLEAMEDNTNNIDDEEASSSTTTDDIQQTQKCFLCISNLVGMKDRRRLKGNLNKCKTKCTVCQKAICSKHRTLDDRQIIRCVICSS